jgi:hypothetical protein
MQKQIKQERHMRFAITLGSAVLALAVLASTAEARMGGMNMPTTLAHGDSRSPTLSTPTAGGHNLNVGRLDNAPGSHWKKPLDSDGGGPDDPPKKSGPTQTTSGGDGPVGGYYDSPRFHHPTYPHGPHFGAPQPDPPLACKGRPGGC